MKYEIRFCTTPEGVRLAYSVFGDGPPLVVVPGWISVLDLNWENSQSSAFWNELAKYFTVLIYDKHGCGLSDRDRTDFSFEKDLRDLESIIDNSKFKRFAFFGYSQSGSVCIAYAIKYPKMVSHLLIYGSYARGADIAPPEVKSAIDSLIKEHWDLGSKILVDMFVPNADPTVLKWAKRFMREAATAKMAFQLSKAVNNIDVTDMLPNLKTPTLVIHRRGDLVTPVKLGRELAASIPDARFVQLDGNIHAPWIGESHKIIKEILQFIGIKTYNEKEYPSNQQIGSEDLYKRRLVAILSADVKGYSRLMGEDELYTIRTLKKCRELIAESVAKHQGQVVDSTGDNILCEFDSVVNALMCAVNIQKKLNDKNAEIPNNRKMLFRIGINLGDIIKSDDRIYGDGVNVAARIEALADGGGICISKSVYDQVKNKVKLKFEYIGEKEVKNINDPVQTYKVDMEFGDANYSPV